MTFYGNWTDCYHLCMIHSRNHGNGNFASIFQYGKCGLKNTSKTRCFFVSEKKIWYNYLYIFLIFNMLTQKEKILDILRELEPHWDIAYGLSELIIRTNNDELALLLHEIILASLEKTKFDLTREKEQNIREKISHLQFEEFNEQENAENYLKNQFNTI